MADKTLSAGLNRAAENRERKAAKLKELESLIPGITDKYKFSDEKNLDAYLVNARQNPAGYTSSGNKQDARLANFIRQVQVPKVTAKVIPAQIQNASLGKKDNIVSKAETKVPTERANKPKQNNDDAYIASLAKRMTPEQMVQSKAVNPNNASFMKYMQSKQASQPVVQAQMGPANAPAEYIAQKAEEDYNAVRALQTPEAGYQLGQTGDVANDYVEPAAAPASQNDNFKSYLADRYGYLRNQGDGSGNDIFSIHAANQEAQEAKLADANNNEAYMQWLANKSQQERN